MTTLRSTPITAADMTKLIHVAAAVILDAQGNILLAQRPADKHQGGLWEFPGGKVEPGEPVIDALYRELDEELGIQLSQAQPLIRIPHHYPDKSVLLDVYTVSAFTGEPYGREGQPVRWVAPADLDLYPFPAANTPIVSAALLPDRLAITGEIAAGLAWPAQQQRYLTQAAQLIAEHDIALLMLRAPQLSEACYGDLAQAMQQLADEQGVTLVLNCALEQAEALSAQGLHLNRHRLAELTHRDQFSGRWLGASCHNVEELAMAVAKGLDYVTLSPVQPTASHPGEPVLGWAEFETLVAELPIPVFALGGVGDAELSQARMAGAQGVAGIRQWWPG